MIEPTLYDEYGRIICPVCGRITRQPVIAAAIRNFIRTTMEKKPTLSESSPAVSHTEGDSK